MGFILSCFALYFTFPLLAETGQTVTTKLSDWCTVETPESAKVGETVEVKVTLQNITVPTKLNCHLHFLKEDGEYGGFWVYAPPVDVSSEGTFSIKFKLTEKENAAKASVTVFLGPDGDWKNRTATCSGGAFPVTK